MVKAIKQIPTSFFLLFLIVFLGILIRFFNLSDNFFFGHDQARDINEIFNMVLLKKPKLVGPGTDIAGFFSGPLYYYLLLPGYFITNFNPNSAAVLLSVINLVGIPLMYIFGRLLKNEKLGLIAAFLWAVSYEQVNFSRFISNPSFLSIASIIFFLGLFLYFLKDKQYGLPLSMLGFGIALQLDPYLIYLFVFYFIFFLFFPKKINKNSLINTLIVFLLFSSTFFISELRFHFLGTTSLLNYFEISGKTGFINIIEALSSYFLSLSRSLYYSFFSFNNFLALLILIGISVIIFIKEHLNKKIIFLFIWILSTLPLFAFKSNVVGGNFIHSSIQGATTLVFALGINYLFNEKRFFFGILTIIIVILSNLNLLIKDQFTGKVVLSHQPMTYAEEKKLIDYTYQSASYKPFSICSVSNPLFVNTLWSTAYKIYGEKKYRYLPLWAGPKQSLNKTFLKNDINHLLIRYLIIEPSNQLPEHATKLTIFLEDQKSTLLEEKKFGQLLVQKRKLNTNSTMPKDTQNLNQNQIEIFKSIYNADYRYSCFMNY